MVKRKHVPVILTVAAVGIGVGIGVWLMRDKIKAATRKISARNGNGNPLDVFGTDIPDDAFQGVANYPHMPEGWRPKRGARD